MGLPHVFVYGMLESRSKLNRLEPHELTRIFEKRYAQVEAGEV